MRFRLVDRILDFEANKKIRIVKNLTLAEEYLADHFPSFPVMPGVLMLETLVEAGAWLLRLSDDFAHSVVVLREARNVKYGTFMQPGKSLVVTVDVAEITSDRSDVQGQGRVRRAPRRCRREVHGSEEYILKRDRNPALASIDQRIVEQFRRESLLLVGRAS